MLIIPAIDLKDGRCVRLRQGRADDETVYGEDPLHMAREWERRGAGMLHVVDLDGAFRGKPVHTGVIAAIAGAVSIPVEVGGGLRTHDDVRMVLDCGVERAILGTRAFTEPDAVGLLAGEFGSRVAVGIDARDGLVQVKGWVEATTLQATELARDMCGMGVETIIYTDVSTDGMLRGPNVRGVAAMCSTVDCRIVASGGISAVADVEALVGLDCPNLVGAIVGKALYEETVSLEDLARAAAGGAGGEAR